MPAVTSQDTSILAGRLEDFCFADILHVLQVSGKSGVLSLERGDGQTALLTFRRGQIVQAVCAECHQTLGDRLVDAGAVSRIDLQQALGHQARVPGMRLGDALVERGAVTRERVEAEVTAQIAETIERLMSWADAEFEFRIGLVDPGSDAPDFAADLVLQDGMEPRHALLEASLLQDRRNRERHLGEKRKGAASATESGAPAPRPAPPPPEKTDEEAEEEARKVLGWFGDGTHPQAASVQDPEQSRAAAAYLSLSEELFAAQGRGEASLLLLRYASEIFASGGLVLRQGSSFHVLGQFGEAFWWQPYCPGEPKTRFEAGESPLFETVVLEKRPYTGLAAVTSSFGLAPTVPGTPGAVPVLALPLFFLGAVSLVLFCRSALADAPDARALIALARQVSVTLENMTLREIAKRSESQGPLSAVAHPDPLTS